ncbi:MAG TPA: ROK family protein [Blastocatellia bacterium]|nr:ROK family protein [Blastocatellia bacterium]
MDVDQPTIVGLDIGGTKTAIVEGTLDAAILQRVEIATEAERPFEEVFPNLVGLTRRVIEGAAGAGRPVKALSVSIGGPLRIAAGELIDPPHLPGWHGVKLKQRLREAFPDLPVYLEHDGNAGALAEFRFGIGRERDDLRHLIFLTSGTGFGGGLIVNGQILHGASDSAGEIGHLRLAPDGPVIFGKAGSWESFASGEGLVKLAARKFPQRWSVQTPIREVVAAMLADDPQALEVAAEVGTWIGRGLALLVDTLNPQVIVLGSLAVALGDRLLEPARRALAAEALPQAVAACEVVPARLGPQIGDVAALMAAIEFFKS